MYRVTAQAATNMSARTTNAARAERLRHLRAQIRSEQIAATLKLEMSNRTLGSGSVGLLVREEIKNDESLWHQFLQYLQVHCTGLHA